MKPGRSKKLTALLRSRLMPEEKELLTEVARGSGATLSQWTRKVCMDAATEFAGEDDKRGEELILAQLSEVKKLVSKLKPRKEEL
jgi:uncharacterized protein (DUF1778 family)